MSTILYCSEVAFWQYDIAVEDDEPFALGAFSTIVTALARTAIGFHEILHMESVRIFIDYRLAVALRSVFDNQHFKVLYRLLAKTFKQLIDLIGAIIYGNDNGVFHSYFKFRIESVEFRVAIAMEPALPQRR